ncbi:MAG: tRNA uracil 4-sulfurtransferase ThiI [Erysipelotrichaceae bacterium]|nr:tRNA uracil 4-sulfurtransferase ThiI [Erysipelotrichaceae bacterium]
MEYGYILVRYGELSTKGKNRNEFIRKLTSNIKFALKAFPALTYDRTYDRLYIRLNGEDPDQISGLLKSCFGLSSFSLAWKVNSDIDAITASCLELVRNLGGTFKMETRRHDKLFRMTSDEINRHIAGVILDNTALKVDVHVPDHRIIVEVRQECTYIMTGSTKGAGGYPVGIGGKALLMLSGGIDSPVAGYLTMKRGVAIECIHFASMPYTSAAALDKVIRLAEKLSFYQGPVRVHIVPFTKLQLALYEHGDESYAITVMRRMMYRIAQKTAEKRHCLALVSGESLGQVASQTLESLAVINEPIQMPVLRPLISFDKLEIIDIACRIDTYNISIEPFEDCCTIFTPHNPVIKPSLKKAQRQETYFDYTSLIEECVELIETRIIVKKSADEDIF